MKKISFMFLSIFISQSAFADIISSDIKNGCNADYFLLNNTHVELLAVWQANSYTCTPGYFLPANAIECVQCLSDNECPGGTYTFNEYISQGISWNDILSTDALGGCVTNYLHSKNNHKDIYAKWTINSYDCDSGYYLPADGIECALCTENSYCSGGTYTYSENTTQGITECPSSTISNTGSSSIEQCTKTLSWDADNGLSPTSATCGYDTYISLPNTPEKTGYTFSGWALSTE